jgi:hypothetical protein
VGALGVLIGLGLPVGETAAALFCTTNSVAQGDAVTPFPPTFLDLNGAAAGIQQFLAFSTSTANQRIRIIFNAEGSMGGATTNWLEANLWVNPAGIAAESQCAPSGGDNSFVPGNGTATQNDGWISAVTQCTAIMPVAGVHTVRVQMDPIPDTVWRLDDLSICVDTL